MDRRLPALFALVVALLLLTNPLYLLPHAGQAEYSHSIERVDASEIPDGATVHDYSDLSPEARHAIDEALASADNHAVVYGEANRPPEFFYSDYASVGQGIYFVHKGGAYYRLTTFAGGGLFPIDLWLQLGMLVFGATLGVVSLRSLRDERRLIPAVFGTLGAAVLLTVAADVRPYGGLGLVAALLAGIVALLVTMGYLLRPRVAAGVTVLFVAALLVGLTYSGVQALTPAFAGLLALLVGIGIALGRVQPIRRWHESTR